MKLSLKKKHQKNYHHGDLAQALVDTSEQLILEKGVEAFSLREAARLVGVDPSACYRHYKDKNAILKALAKKGFTAMAQSMNEDLKKKAHASTEEKIETLCLGYFHFADKAPALFRVMFGQLGVDSRDASLKGHYENDLGPYDILIQVVTAWSTEKKFKKNPQETALELWAAIHGLTCLAMDGAVQAELSSKDKTRKAIASLAKTMMRGLS